MTAIADHGGAPRARTGAEKHPRRRLHRASDFVRGRTAESAAAIALTLLSAAIAPAEAGSRSHPETEDSGARGITAERSFETDCRACHDSGVPDRHHRLYGQSIGDDSVVPFPDANGDGAPDAAYVCLNCHGASFTVTRNCVACHSSPVGTVPDGAAVTEDPLTITISFGALSLNWDPSCGVSDTDYAVYEGTLGDFTSHMPRLCSTDGSTAATISPPAGNAYYLVVPRNHWSEGSYGPDSDGAQRPPSAAACLSQSIGCP